MVSVFDPQAIYLFGSRAWGQPTEDSDVDLLVVVKSSDDPPWTRASKGFAQLRGVGVGCDLIVKTEAEVQAEGRFASVNGQDPARRQKGLCFAEMSLWMPGFIRPGLICKRLTRVYTLFQDTFKRLLNNPLNACFGDRCSFGKQGVAQSFVNQGLVTFAGLFRARPKGGDHIVIKHDRQSCFACG